MLLLDALSIIDASSELGQRKEMRDRFVDLCKQCCGVFLPEDYMKLMIETLSDEALNSRYVKTKTRI